MLSQLVRSRNAASQLRFWKGRSLLQSPTIPRLHSSTSRISALQTSANSHSSETRPRRSSFQSSRSLATAVDPPVPGSSYLENPSYYSDLREGQQWASYFPPPPGEFNPSSLVIVSENVQTKPKVFKKIRGIGGDEEEMMVNLDLCLRHAQFERASNLINKLREFHPIGSESYRDMHNQLLQAMVSHAISTNDFSLTQQVQRWFEVDMPWGGVQPDATTFAIMIKMSLRIYYGGKRDRAVRRYWQRAKQAQVEEDVLADPVLTDRELGELSEICSWDLQRVAIASMEVRDERAAGDQSPEVRPTDQKGLGLSSLKESMSSFAEAPLPMKIDVEDIESKELYDIRRQEQLESGVIEAAVRRWRQENEEMQKLNPDAVLTGKGLSPTIAQWHRDLSARIQDELNLVQQAEENPVKTQLQKVRCDYGFYLRALSPDNLASLTILACMGSLVRNGLEKGIKLAPLVVQIGNDVYDETMAHRILEDRQKSSENAHRVNILKKMLAGRKGKDGSIRWRKMVEKMEQENASIVWPIAARAKLGAVLMNCLFEVAKVPAPAEGTSQKAGKKPQKMSVPAFEHSYQINWGRRNGFIHVHPELTKMMRREPASDLIGRSLPMVCKPRPWTEFNEGAYYLHRNRIVRSTPGESLQPAYVKAAMENGGLEKIREGLDILGSTGWVINQDVFNVMLEAWNSGETVADLAPIDPDMPIPPRPSPEDGQAALKEWNSMVREIENRKSGYHSQRCFQNFQMEIARAYLNETFYFPHNMDFRGRAYPIPPYLNQMGADNARGLLLFSNPKRLGESGLRWLKIQIANLSGFDKASLSERERYTMDHLDDVLDSANNGLHGRRWWLQAEDPWQCLAACCELRNAMQLENPADYASRLPIHQDGSCNGLQHYAALGGDIIGAQQVNLEPSDRPSDVYSGVAEFVKASIMQEAKEGNPIAKLLDGKVTRKVVKQTVMTNVYGVTFIGAMKQVRKQLTSHYPDFTDDQLKNGAIYIARKIFRALGTMFNGAHDIQYWFGDCASRITVSLSPDEIDKLANDYLLLKEQNPSVSTPSMDPLKHFKSTVVWTTPLGLPVVQPYRARVARRVDTSFQGLSIVAEDSNFNVSKRKQLQAFPPNFIHSLDATHMILSASACHAAGLTFSAVHDSFWTHASDIDSMNEILREAFVLMHSDDIIGRLASEFKVRYGRNLFYARLRPGSEAAKAVKMFRKQNKRSTRFFELLEEHKRQKLLNSDDPELQAQGRAMHTAASVFEQFGGSEADIVMNSSLGETAVGHIPEDVEAAEEKYHGLDSELADRSDPAMEGLLGKEFEGSARDPAAVSSDENAAEEVDEASEEADETDLATADADSAPKKKRVRTPRTQYVNLWLPMQFQDVPKKGEWDLTRIRDSKYFFS
ncbi:hypothetical protein BDV18DRAFT_139120 [Aspergillus unguis]